MFPLGEVVIQLVTDILNRRSRRLAEPIAHQLDKPLLAKARAFFVRRGRDPARIQSQRFTRSELLHLRDVLEIAHLPNRRSLRSLRWPRLAAAIDNKRPNFSRPAEFKF